MAGSDRGELEALWRARLRRATERLETARTQLVDVEVSRSLEEFPPADGDFAYRKALREETAALVEYSRILRITTDLVVSGKIPEDPK